MEESTFNFGPVGSASKSFVRRLLTIGENRIELLAVEVQEERVRLLRAILLALGVVALGLLSAIAFTAAVVVLLWRTSPLVVLLILAGIYGAGAIALYYRLTGLLRDWQTLPATLDQLRKDRACFEKILN